MNEIVFVQSVLEALSILVLGLISIGIVSGIVIVMLLLVYRILKQ